MSPDSINQWQQASSGKFNNAHPFLHTLIIFILQRIWNTPASLAILQILLSSVICSLFLNFFIKSKINKYVIFICFIFIISSPVIGIYNVTLWKDILYTQMILYLAYRWIIDYAYKVSNKRYINDRS
jgi:hypothetical protein